MGEIPLQKSPQGYLSLGDSYIRHTDTITEDCPSTTSYREFEKIVDDIIMHSDTVEGAFQRICSILSQCNKNGLVFNSEKFRFARREADAISRCKHLHMFYVSVGQTMVADKDYDFSQLLEVVHVVINLVNSDTEANTMSWNIIFKAMQEDGTMLKLMDHIQRGMPDSGLELDKTLREYHRFCHDLHMVNGVLCYRDCIMLPAALRGKVLEGIHAAHQGVSGMAGRIAETVFWPEINPDIINTRGSCMQAFQSPHRARTTPSRC